MGWSEVTYNALMGALTGGVFEAPGNAAAEINNYASNSTYYLEQILEGNKLINAQMIKTPRGVVPNLPGLAEAMNNKKGTNSAPGAVVGNATSPQMYVQDVWNGTSDNISQAKNKVNGRTIGGEYPRIYTEYLQNRGQSPTEGMPYAEHLLKQAEKKGNIYAKALIKAEMEKAQRNSRKAGIDASATMPTIYADYMRKHNMLEDYEDADSPNVDLENNTDSGTINPAGSVSHFDEIQENHTIDDDIGTVKRPTCNPNYSSGEWGYTQNCQRCVPAYELRRRGKDVVATERPIKQNRIIWGTECFTDTKGNPVSFVHFKSAKQVQDELSKAPDGARYSIFVQWTDHSSHVFIAEKEAGIVRYVDPQTGITDVSHYFQKGLKNRFGFFRMDDKLISSDKDLIREVIKSAKDN